MILKNSLLIIVACLTIPAGARGGSGGTSGGNPKPIEAEPFTKDKVRASKLAAAVDLLRHRLPNNCFPKDYNDAVLAEVDRLLASRNLYYFPETVLLGSNRYEGDYGQEKMPNGNVKFYHVGAFTEKVKGMPIYFTKDSDKFDAEELAMTFVQDVNDHVLQWKNETQLNSVGAMAMGAVTCKANDINGAYNVFAQFPEKDRQFPHRRADFFFQLQGAIESKGSANFGNFVIRRYKLTRDGFEFLPDQYNIWDSRVGGFYSVPVRNPKPLEVVFSPFTLARMEGMSDGDEELKGIVRDLETRTIITEFSWKPSYMSPLTKGDSIRDSLNMDTICESREFSGLHSIRHPTVKSPTRWRACTIRVTDGKMEIIINRTRASLCGENPELDYFNYTKSVDDYAREPYCMWDLNREFTEANYDTIVGDRKPERFVRELMLLNESHYREANGISAGTNVWINKNVLGGRLSLLHDMLGVVRDEAGAIYSVYVGLKGQFIRKDRIENLEDEHDWAFQCFFQGPDAGKCVERYYEN